MRSANASRARARPASRRSPIAGVICGKRTRTSAPERDQDSEPPPLLRRSLHTVTRLHRNINIAAVILPFAAFLAAVPMLWNELVGWTDLALFAGMYVVSTVGITVGFHRLLTHRAFQTYKPIEYLFAACGSMAVEGPVIGWVSDHRRHHAFADEDGDPHSPHGHGDGFAGTLKGLWHAHLGLAVRPPDRRGRREVRARPARGPRHAHGAPVLRAARGARPGDPLRPRLADLGRAGGRPHRALLGRPGARLPGPPRDVLDQLDLPLLRAPALHDRGRVDQRVLARSPLLRRVLAPQPPRLPPLGAARAALVGGGPGRLGDPRDAPARAGLERGADHEGAPAAEAGRGGRSGAGARGGSSRNGARARRRGRRAARERAEAAATGPLAAAPAAPSRLADRA